MTAIAAILLILLVIVTALYIRERHILQESVHTCNACRGEMARFVGDILKVEVDAISVSRISASGCNFQPFKTREEIKYDIECLLSEWLKSKEAVNWDNNGSPVEDLGAYKEGLAKENCK